MLNGVFCILFPAEFVKMLYNLYSPGEASDGILASISVTAYEAVLDSKCKDQPVATNT